MCQNQLFLYLFCLVELNCTKLLYVALCFPNLPYVALCCPMLPYVALCCPKLTYVTLGYPSVGLYCSNADSRVSGGVGWCAKSFSCKTQLSLICWLFGLVWLSCVLWLSCGFDNSIKKFFLTFPITCPGQSSCFSNACGFFLLGIADQLGLSERQPSAWSFQYPCLLSLRPSLGVSLGAEKL